MATRFLWEALEAYLTVALCQEASPTARKTGSRRGPREMPSLSVTSKSDFWTKRRICTKPNSTVRSLPLSDFLKSVRSPGFQARTRCLE